MQAAFARVVFAVALGLCATGAQGARAEDAAPVWRTGISTIGELKHPDGFAHFDYVDPDAPKGGELKLSETGTYDTFNPILSKGEAASGVSSLVFDTLLKSAEDEITTAYGLPVAGATWQTDWFFNIGLWPNTTFYCFPFTDLVGTFIMIPLEAEKSLLRFGYYAPDHREVPALTKAAVDWMNKELGPEDIALNISNQKGLHSFGYDQGRYLVDDSRSNQSEHLVRHFHQLCYQAIRE